MKIAVFSAKRYDQVFFERENAEFQHELHFFEPRLTIDTVSLATGYPGICIFVNDQLNGVVMERLAMGGTKIVALRCAGFNNVDLPAAERFNIRVVRVPAYSPYSVAEHTAGLVLSLNRKIHRAYARVRDGNFSLDGLLGFDLHGRTVGVIGTGKIGSIFAKIMNGFGCRLLGYDTKQNPDCVALGMQYTSIDELFANSDVISLHCPLTTQTKYLVNSDSIQKFKPGTMLINTSRGAVIDSRAVIDGLKCGRIGSLGIDVYEEESEYFFEDLSDQFIADDVLARLLTFPNVIVTSHQAFFTQEAMVSIAETTLLNVRQLAETGHCENEVFNKPAQLSS